MHFPLPAYGPSSPVSRHEAREEIADRARSSIFRSAEDAALSTRCLARGCPLLWPEDVDSLASDLFRHDFIVRPDCEPEPILRAVTPPREVLAFRSALPLLKAPEVCYISGLAEITEDLKRRAASSLLQIPARQFEREPGASVLARHFQQVA